MAVYAATKVAVHTISEGLRQEAGDKLRVTVISPDAIARAIAFAIEQPADVDVEKLLSDPLQ